MARKEFQAAFGHPSRNVKHVVSVSGLEWLAFPHRESPPALASLAVIFSFLPSNWSLLVHCSHGSSWKERLFKDFFLRTTSELKSR